jgi:hypothetical protein
VQSESETIIFKIVKGPYNPLKYFINIVTILFIAQAILNGGKQGSSFLQAAGVPNEVMGWILFLDLIILIPLIYSIYLTRKYIHLGDIEINKSEKQILIKYKDEAVNEIKFSDIIRIDLKIKGYRNSIEFPQLILNGYENYINIVFGSHEMSMEIFIDHPYEIDFLKALKKEIDNDTPLPPKNYLRPTT